MLSLVLAEASVAAREEATIDWWLTVIAVLVVVWVILLLGFALAYRRISRSRTRPCPYCMEFIPKKAEVCPRCGKALGAIKE